MDGQPVTVYLSGPITGLTYEEAMAQRQEVTARLTDAGMRVLSPMRGKSYLSHQFASRPLPSGGYKRPALSDRALLRRDWMDVVKRADVIFVNLLNTKEVSIGTVMEIGFTVNAGKFVVVVLPKENIHDHAFVRAAADVILHDLEEGIQCVLDWAGA